MFHVEQSFMALESGALVCPPPLKKGNESRFES